MLRILLEYVCCVLDRQEHNRHIQEECAACVGEEGPETNSVDLGHLYLGDFQEESNCEVHDAADWGKVVERDKGIHLELRSIKQPFNHADSDCLERNSSNLIQETGQDEVDFSERGQGDTDDNERDVSKLLEVDWMDLKDPASNKNSDWCESLEHLDERNTQVQVCQVSADQAQTEEYSNGHDSSEVYSSSHLNRFPTIQKSCGPSHDLGHDGCEDQMP